MPVSKPSATGLHFRSANDFFKSLAQSIDAEHSARRPCPGMLYRIGSRQMRFVFDPFAAPANALRLEDHSRTRFAWLPQRLVAILFPSRASVIRADSDCAIRYRCTRERRHALHSRVFDNIKAGGPGQAGPGPSAAQGAASDAPIPAPDRLRQAVLDEFMPEVRDAMEAIRDLYGMLPLPDANEEARRILFPIRQRLETRLFHCGRAGMSAAEIHATMKAFAIDSRLESWNRISLAYPDVERRRLELAKVTVHPTPTREFPHLDFDLDTVPAPMPDIEAFNEVALGDMHGNCELLLHSLVKVGLVRIRDNSAWLAAQQLIKNVADTPASAKEYRRFRALLAKAIMVEPAAVQKKLVLLGDLLADRRHNDLYLLAVLDRLHDGGLAYDITLSNHDAQFIHYLASNNGVPEDRPYQLRGISIGPAQTVSLQRLNELMNQDPSLRRELRDMASRAYFGHLKAVSTTTDGRKFYAHAVVNESIFTDLCRQAGISEAQPGVAAVQQINAWFQGLLSTPAAYAAAMTELLPNGSPTALFACCWNVGVGDDRYRNSDAEYATHPYPNNPCGPHPDFEAVVHGHTRKPGDRLHAETERLLNTSILIERNALALKDGVQANAGELNSLIQTPANMSGSTRKATSLLMTAAMHQRPIGEEVRTALEQCREAAEHCSRDGMQGLTQEQQQERLSGLVATYNRAWSIHCRMAGVRDAAVLDEGWIDSLLESLQAQRDGSLATRLDTAASSEKDRLMGSLRQIAAIAQHYPPPHGDQDGTLVAIIEGYEARLTSSFHSLDSDAGMGAERRFRRTVFLA